MTERLPVPRLIRTTNVRGFGQAQYTWNLFKRTGKKLCGLDTNTLKVWPVRVHYSTSGIIDSISYIRDTDEAGEGVDEEFNKDSQMHQLIVALYLQLEKETIHLH